MAFNYRGQLSGGKENPVTLQVGIANSQTVTVGDAVKLQALSSGGGILPATAGSKIFGIVVGITDQYGIDLDNTSPSNFDGTWTSGTKAYAAASNNMTNKLVKAKVIVDENSLWYNDAAGDLVVADEFKYFDITSATQIADQNGNDTAGAFLLVRRDPDGDADASKGLFKIAESYLQPYVQQ